MKNIYKFYTGILFAALLTSNVIYSQDPPPKQPMLPSQPAASFDVIIKKNGDIIYGLVKEVNEEYIKYQRTDIPNGPIYSVLKKDVYAISYRNQMREIVNPVSQFPETEASASKMPPMMRDTVYPVPPPPPAPLPEKERKTTWQIKNGNLLIGVGFIRGISQVENADNYSTSTTFPILSLAYEVKKDDNLRVGIQLATGTHKFTRQEYSAYDSAARDITLKEKVFTANVYGKYFLKGFSGSLHPYLLGGLGLQSSYVKSEYTLDFINNTNQTIIVKSGARSIGISALLRAGANYKLNDQLFAFADVGIGPAIIQIGISFKLDPLNKK
jgi:outer membrane protein W